jgi:hypothetical protein
MAVPISAYLHHPAPRAVVGLLELIPHGNDLGLEAGTLQVVADRADVPRPLPVEIKEREDANLASHPQQLLEGGGVEVQVKPLGAAPLPPR